LVGGVIPSKKVLIITMGNPVLNQAAFHSEGVSHISGEPPSRWRKLARIERAVVLSMTMRRAKNGQLLGD
jgi:hypothetical protein